MALWLLGWLTASAQVLDPGAATEARHLAIMGGWSAANLVGGTTGYVLADDPQWRNFHGTNAAWNVVNGAIVAAGALGLNRRRDGFETPEALAKHQRGLQTSLAINIGLDVAYVGTGAALMALGASNERDDLRGMGQSLILQGGFLLVFDSAFLASLRAKTRG